MKKLPHNLTLLLVAQLVLLAACKPPTPIVTTETPAVGTSPAPSPTPPDVLSKYELPKTPTDVDGCRSLENITTTPVEGAPEPKEIFVDHQILLTGGPQKQGLTSDIDKIVQELPELAKQEVPVDRLPIEFSVPGNLSIEIRLYNLPDPIPVWDEVAKVNNLAFQNGLRVVAEPNYLTDLPIGGSGNDGGSGIVGDPSGPGGRIGDGQAHFVSQWSFSGSNSIGLFDAGSATHYWIPKTPKGDLLTGLNTRVVVFDTTPLSQGDRYIKWAVLPFHLCVWQPGLRFGVSGAAAASSTPNNHVSKGEHGLFVSGLAQGLAPWSEYYLIEVLDSEARGDVYTLIRAIALYLEHSSSMPEMNTVFNLSLGIEAERQGLGRDAAAAAAREALLNNLKKNFLQFKDYPNLAEFKDYATQPELADHLPVISLKWVLVSAEQNGVVVVAAAGNDRGANPNAQEQAPANYSEVVGVAASNSGGKAACFSNPGDLAAPGGDGQVSSTCLEETPNFCDSSAADCPQGVVSLVTLRKDTSGYAYWMGTSFSTPMVSGLAALVWEAAPTRSSTDVRDVLECGVTPVSPGSSPILGLGIINVGESLFHCP